LIRASGLEGAARGYCIVNEVAKEESVRRTRLLNIMLQRKV